MTLKMKAKTYKKVADIKINNLFLYCFLYNIIFFKQKILIKIKTLK
jgi:hypothetical protein